MSSFAHGKVAPLSMRTDLVAISASIHGCPKSLRMPFMLQAHEFLSALSAPGDAL